MDMSVAQYLVAVFGDKGAGVTHLSFTFVFEVMLIAVSYPDEDSYVCFDVS